MLRDYSKERFRCQALILGAWAKYKPNLIFCQTSFSFAGWAMGLCTIPGHQQGARCKAARSDE